jgi:cyclase
MSPHALCGLLFFAVTAAAACETAAYTRFQVTPNVTLFQSAEGTPAIVNGNIVAISGKDATLVVDTGQFPGNARRAIAELKAGGKPVKYVVNTHWHGDHLLANAQFREAYPEARFIAHSHTIAEAAKRYDAEYGAKSRKSIPIVADQFRKRREETKSDEERLWIDRTLACVDFLLAELEHTRYAAPDMAVDAELRIDLGDLPVVIRHIGAGNTPGDLVVWVEKDRLVASGDLLVYPSPYAIGSDLGPWVGTLDNLQKMSPKLLVPGHGPVMRDDTYLVDVRALIKSTRAQFDEMLAKGVAKADAAGKLDTRAFGDKYLDTPMKRQAFEQFFVKAAVQQAWPKAEPAVK